MQLMHTHGSIGTLNKDHPKREPKGQGAKETRKGKTPSKGALKGSTSNQSAKLESPRGERVHVSLHPAKQSFVVKARVQKLSGLQAATISTPADSGKRNPLQLQHPSMHRGTGTREPKWKGKPNHKKNPETERAPKLKNARAAYFTALAGVRLLCKKRRLATTRQQARQRALNTHCKHVAQLEAGTISGTLVTKKFASSWRRSRGTAAPGRT